ncbi:MAG: hypothetical protein N2C14_07870 [Planctomycetales bacterium]
MSAASEAKHFFQVDSMGDGLFWVNLKHVEAINVRADNHLVIRFASGKNIGLGGENSVKFLEWFEAQLKAEE